MDFFSLLMFLALYYLRPQEWFETFNKLHPVQILSVLALWAMARKGSYKKLLQTPLDWMMFAYFVWTLICGFTPLHTWNGIQSVVLCYFVGVTTLDTIPRLKRFLGWWSGFIVAIAALAIASEYGFDPFNSQYLTQGIMKGRLILNLTIFANPNALAHAMIPGVPLLYYLLYWRRVTTKVAALLIIVPLYCIYLTQSKGAFLCGFVTILATLIFGRNLAWQILILSLAVGVGYGALYALPRMNELNNAQSDPAIQGRVAALTYGLKVMKTHPFGIGLGNFEKSFLQHGPLEPQVTKRVVPRTNTVKHVVVYRHYSKATHGAYNQNGAELGYVGLYLFVGILYCCIRTLMLVKSQDDDEERIRRALFSLVVAYAASSWMVDFCYRPTFFMFVAAISAFHRHLLRKQAAEQAAPVEADGAPMKPWLRRLPPMPAFPGLPEPVLAVAASGPGRPFHPAPLPWMRDPSGAEPLQVARSGNSGNTPGGPEPEKMPGWKKRSFQEKLQQRFIWTRLGVPDFLLMLGLTAAAILYWQHLIAHM